MNSNPVLVTGAAGFIGFHVSQRLMEQGRPVLGVDNLSSFYDQGLKAARLQILRQNSRFGFLKIDIADLSSVENLFAQHEFGEVIHLAAQAGVRYSLENPHLYVQSNVVGFVNLLEAARKKKTPHFVFASSSSVYGANKKIPFAEKDNVDHPVSLYAATKKSDELIAHVYAHLYGIPLTGLRFFTVYGPWGRPDMALFKFCKSIIEGTPIEVFNHGKMLRDFTYIDDIVEGVVRTVDRPPREVAGDADGSLAPYRIYNIGNNQPVELARLIQILEQKIGRKAVVKMLPMQPGDVPATYADIDELSAATGYRPHTPIEHGVERFVDWYISHYKIALTASPASLSG
ncbi:MAG TPA: NAD-dependent epimerase [Candidatus Angelobacter sp.]|nr:NAD-dependent epimerase [Candidatus Angelobacter sp.]